MKELENIKARETKASAELGRICDGKPGTNWRWSIPANPERDSDLILADSIADIPRLLAALDAVIEYVAYNTSDITEGDVEREIWKALA